MVPIFWVTAYFKLHLKILTLRRSYFYDRFTTAFTTAYFTVLFFTNVSVTRQLINSFFVAFRSFPYFPPLHFFHFISFLFGVYFLLRDTSISIRQWIYRYQIMTLKSDLYKKRIMTYNANFFIIKPASN